LLSLSWQPYLGVDDQLLEPFLRPLTLVEEEQAMVFQVVPIGKVEKAKLSAFIVKLGEANFSGKILGNMKIDLKMQKFT
jgi:hypothetical protein